MGQGAIGTGELIGREAELVTARAALRDAGGVLVMGPPGVGKTALARSLLAGAPASGNLDIRWLVVTATGPAIPFGPFVPLVPEVGGLPAPGPGPGARPDPASFDL